jgi:hypothetical protein
MPEKRDWKNFRPRMLGHFLPVIVRAPLLQNNLNFPEEVIA